MSIPKSRPAQRLHTQASVVCEHPELEFEEIQRAATSMNGRYHQIGFMGDRLAVVATEKLPPFP